MQNDKNFDDIRPYTNEEMVAAMPFVASTGYLQQVVRYASADLTEQQIQDRICSCVSIKDFIGKIAYPAVSRLLENTSKGLTFEGLDKLSKDKGYVFLSNHRDIVMDSVLLNLGLFARDMPVAQSAIGDNLVPDRELLTISKINKNFVVQRSLPPRETLEFSLRLSQYIGHVIHDIGDNVWLAHREGRAKDGDDRTYPGVIKMLAMAAEGDILDYLKSLHIVPMAISYQWDATDALKLRELLARAKGLKYVKAPGEDLHSIITGIAGRKGRIHIAVGKPLEEELDALRPMGNATKQFRAVCSLVDTAIHRLYKLFPTNYVAYDMLYDTERYAANYSSVEKEEFIDRVENLVATGADEKMTRQIVLRMYANPVINKIEAENDK